MNWEIIVAIIIPCIGVIGSYAVLSERVRKHGEEQKTLVADLAEKIDRREFDAGMSRLDALHTDLKEIRDLLIKVILNFKQNPKEPLDF